MSSVKRNVIYSIIAIHCHILCWIILVPTCGAWWIFVHTRIYIHPFIYHHRYLGGSCKGEGCDDIDNEIVRVTLHYKNPVKRPTVHHFTCQVTTNLVTQLGGQENVRRLQRLIKCEFRIVKFWVVILSKWLGLCLPSGLSSMQYKKYFK